MFKAFELTSAYQPFLNPDIEEKYREHRGKMMADINSKLKEDFMENQKYIGTQRGLGKMLKVILNTQSILVLPP